MAAGRAGGGGREEQEVREDARKEAALARAGSAGASDQAEGGIGVGSAEAVGGGAAPGVSTSRWAPARAAELVRKSGLAPSARFQRTEPTRI